MSLIKDIDQIFTFNNIIKNHLKKCGCCRHIQLCLEKKKHKKKNNNKLVNNKRIRFILRGFIFTQHLSFLV